MSGHYTKRADNFLTDMSPEPAKYSSKLGVWASRHLLLQFAKWFHFRPAMPMLQSTDCYIAIYSLAYVTRGISEIPFF